MNFLFYIHLVWLVLFVFILRVFLLLLMIFGNGFSLRFSYFAFASIGSSGRFSQLTVLLPPLPPDISQFNSA